MNISVIGGDSRLVELVKILEKNKNTVFLYGLEKSEKLVGFNHIENIEDCLEKSNLVITSIPLSKDGKIINSVFTDKIIFVKDFFEKIKNNFTTPSQ